MYLFVDTTEKITLGLISKEMEWIEFIVESKSKISAQIHSFIYGMLSKQNIKIQDLDGVIYCAGPGSYTGMRVSEGFTDILDWQGIRSYTFFHFELPALLGFDKGDWVSEAFKGEYFVYSWDKDKSEKKLVKKDEYSFKDGQNIFTKNEGISGDTIHYTDDFLRSSPDKIFPQVLEMSKREDILYYRKLEQEFSR